jgi:hypothetical protein
MVEEDKIIFNDYEIISELTTFISKSIIHSKQKKDVMMTWQCVCNFAWLLFRIILKK